MFIGLDNVKKSTFFWARELIGISIFFAMCVWYAPDLQHWTAEKGLMLPFNFLDTFNKTLYPNTKETADLLHSAASGGQHKIITLLLDRGDDIELINRHNLTPLQHAILFAEAPTIDFLLDHGARIDNYVHNKIPPLFFALMAQDKNAIPAKINTLLDHGADLNSMATIEDIARVTDPEATIDNKERISIIDFAVTRHVLDGLVALLERGAKPQPQALYVAIDLGNIYAIDLLCKAGVRVNGYDKDRVTPLHYAVLMRNKDAVSVLLSHGADVSAPIEYNFIKNLNEKDSVDDLIVVLKWYEDLLKKVQLNNALGISLLIGHKEIEHLLSRAGATVGVRPEDLIEHVPEENREGYQVAVDFYKDILFLVADDEE